jgi:hypothetical protein
VCLLKLLGLGQETTQRFERLYTTWTPPTEVGYSRRLGLFF